jgi:hypothetical protein
LIGVVDQNEPTFAKRVAKGTIGRCLYHPAPVNGDVFLVDLRQSSNRLVVVTFVERLGVD